MADILATFKAAVAAYNAYNWNTLIAFLDTNVVLKLPDKTQAPIYGKSNVINYLRGEAQDKPTFDPQPDNTKPIKVHDMDDDIGYITHRGSWVDDNHSKRPIRYAFAFINNGSAANPNWQILLLWSNN